MQRTRTNLSTCKTGASFVVQRFYQMHIRKVDIFNAASLGSKYLTTFGFGGQAVYDIAIAKQAVTRPVWPYHMASWQNNIPSGKQT